MEMLSDYQPLVSFIIPAYNHERFVKACLSSILADSYGNKEILICNDGSTDNTNQKIIEWIDTHGHEIAIKHLTQSNKGVCYTLNKLLFFANGEYIVPLASDDCIIPGSVQMRISYLNKNPDLLSVFGDCVVINEEDKIISSSSLTEYHTANLNNLLNPELLKEEMIWHWSVSGPSILLKKEIYSCIGLYDPSLKTEDWDYYLRMVSQGVLGFINEKVGYYRIHSDNVSQSSRNNYIHFDLFKIALKNLPRFKGSSQKLLVKKALVYILLMLKQYVR